MQEKGEESSSTHTQKKKKNEAAHDADIHVSMYILVDCRVLSMLIATSAMDRSRDISNHINPVHTMVRRIHSVHSSLFLSIMYQQTLTEAVHR